MCRLQTCSHNLYRLPRCEGACQSRILYQATHFKVCCNDGLLKVNALRFDLLYPGASWRLRVSTLSVASFIASQYNLDAMTQSTLAAHMNSKQSTWERKTRKNKVKTLTPVVNQDGNNTNYQREKKEQIGRQVRS